MTLSAAEQQQRRTSHRTLVVSLIVACALFMQNLDSTVIATALPTMADAFHANPVHMSIALTSYLLSLAVFIPASGWMADRFGSRQVFRAAIVVFTIGSILCGQANGLATLVGARIIQGLGGAMMVPVGRLVLLRTVPKHEMVAAMAWLSMPALLGPVLGPPLGGFIVTNFSWRWIFYINVPIGLLGVVLITFFIDDVHEESPSRFDGWGLLWSGLGLSAMMVGFETAGRHVVAASWSVAAFAVGIGACLAYWRHAKHHPRPLLDLSLLKVRTFAVSCYAGSLFRFGVGALPFLMPLLLQLRFGYSAERSGLTTFASAAGAIIVKPVATWVLRRFGFRDTLLVNGAFAAISLALCAIFRPGWPVWGIFLVLLVGGVFRSVQFSAYNTVVFADIDRPRMSAATSLYSTIQQLSITIGISVGAAVLEITRAFSGDPLPTLNDFSMAFLSVAVIAMISVPMVTLISRHAGAEMSGQRSVPLPEPESAAD